MPGHREISVDVEGESIRCLLAEPDQLSAQPALILNFALDRVTMLQQHPYDIAARMFLDAGHRAASFDLPCHGERGLEGDPGGGAGFIAQWQRGQSRSQSGGPRHPRHLAMLSGELEERPGQRHEFGRRVQMLPRLRALIRKSFAANVSNPTVNLEK
ncbi:MAG: hypothetical protein CMJ18_16525 [Phycisphaeraceae bacterium]|nr:hypothetical protein [Phycisphaeraceae bacterium]